MQIPLALVMQVHCACDGGKPRFGVQPESFIPPPIVARLSCVAQLKKAKPGTAAALRETGIPANAAPVNVFVTATPHWSGWPGAALSGPGGVG